MAKNTKGKSSKQGFSMVEVLVAVAIMALGILPVMNLASAGLRETSMAREDVLVKNVALDLLERYAAATPEQLAAVGDAEQSDEDAEKAIASDEVLNGVETSESLAELGRLSEPMTLTRRVDFEKDAAATGLNLLTVRVSFGSQGRGERSVVMYRFLYQPQAAPTVASADSDSHGA